MEHAGGLPPGTAEITTNRDYPLRTSQRAHLLATTAGHRRRAEAQRRTPTRDLRMRAPTCRSAGPGGALRRSCAAPRRTTVPIDRRNQVTAPSPRWRRPRQLLVTSSEPRCSRPEKALLDSIKRARTPATQQAGREVQGRHRRAWTWTSHRPDRRDGGPTPTIPQRLGGGSPRRKRAIATREQLPQPVAAIQGSSRRRRRSSNSTPAAVAAGNSLSGSYACPSAKPLATR